MQRMGKRFVHSSGAHYAHAIIRVLVVWVVSPGHKCPGLGFVFVYAEKGSVYMLVKGTEPSFMFARQVFFSSTFPHTEKKNAYKPANTGTTKSPWGFAQILLLMKL